MSIQLPKINKDSRQGFTLIELLVVIAIIAILAVIGFAVFSGVQNRARNDARRADIDSIAKALEVNRAATGYIALAASQFSNGVIPVADAQGVAYCGNSTASTQPANITASGCAAPAGYAAISATIPPAGISWKICTWLEAEGATAAVGFCKGSAQ